MACTNTVDLENGSIIRLSLAVSAVGFGQSAVLALVPITADRTGLDAAAMGGVAFLGAIVFLACAPVWGHLGTGRRLRPLFFALGGLMILGHGLFGLALTLENLPAAGALTLLVLARLAYGAGAAGVMPHAQAAVVRLTPDAVRPAALGRLSAGLSTGRILGSLVTVVGALGTAAPLVLLAASPLMLLFAPDLAPGRKAGAAGAGRPGPWMRSAYPLLAVGFALTFGLGQIQIALGLFAQARFALDPAAAAALAGSTFALVAVVMIAVQVALVPRLGRDLRRTLRLGLFGFTLGAGLIAGAGAPWVAVLGACAAAAGIALATPTYTASLVARVPEERQASAAAWLSSIHVVGQGIGALCGGAAFRLAPALPFWTCVAIGCALVVGASGLPGGARAHRADP